MDLGFGDRLFITVMTTFGLGFLWLGWLERFIPLWVVPIIGFLMGLILLWKWWKGFKLERARALREIQSMREQGKGGIRGRA